MHRFTGQAVLVTGSTRGIWAAVAAKLVAEGATVGLHGRQEQEVTEQAAALSATGPGRAIPLAADFNENGEPERILKAFIGETGRLDGLVNNAGYGKARAFRGVRRETWQQTFRVNLEAAAFASREAYLTMRRQKRGAIVNMASLAAHGPGKWMSAEYAASKAGLISLTKSLAFEAGRLGIRVNAVSPGMIETDMTAALPESTRAGLGIPMARLGRPEEVASAVTFLLSDESAYVTGQVLHVNGGLWM